jgi:hypothetical protein
MDLHTLISLGETLVIPAKRRARAASMVSANVRHRRPLAARNHAHGAGLRVLCPAGSSCPPEVAATGDSVLGSLVVMENSINLEWKINRLATLMKGMKFIKASPYIPWGRTHVMMSREPNSPKNGFITYRPTALGISRAGLT